MAYQNLVPKACIRDVLHELHGIPFGGHRDVKGILPRVRGRFYWVNYRQDTEDRCRRCELYRPEGITLFLTTCSVTNENLHVCHSLERIILYNRSIGKAKPRDIDTFVSTRGTVKDGKSCRTSGGL